MTGTKVRCLNCQTNSEIETYFCQDPDCDGHIKTNTTDTVFIFVDDDQRINPRCKWCGAVMYETLRYIQ